MHVENFQLCISSKTANHLFRIYCLRFQVNSYLAFLSGRHSAWSTRSRCRNVKYAVATITRCAIAISLRMFWYSTGPNRTMCAYYVKKLKLSCYGSRKVVRRKI